VLPAKMHVSTPPSPFFETQRLLVFVCAGREGHPT
jgi:hypothetical protein